MSEEMLKMFEDISKSIRCMQKYMEYLSERIDRLEHKRNNEPWNGIKNER